MSRFSHHGNYMKSYAQTQHAATAPAVESPEQIAHPLPAKVTESRAMELQRLREDLAGMQERLDNWGAALVGTSEALDVLRYRLKSAVSELESADLMARGQLALLNH